MTNDKDYWQKQGKEALFPELEWNKPERRDQAGRILIVGGHLHALNAAAKAYEIVNKTGIGEAKIVLPSSTKRLVGATLPDALFLPSTPSGELSLDGESELFSFVHWADMLLLPGDLGRNSQTTQLLEKTLINLTTPAIITKDALDALSNRADLLLNREQTTLIASFAELQKLVKLSGFETALTYDLDLTQIVELLHSFTQKHKASLVTFHQNQLVVAFRGNVSTTATKPVNENTYAWRTEVASLAACYLTWNPYKPFEALTFSAHSFVG